MDQRRFAEFLRVTAKGHAESGIGMRWFERLPVPHVADDALPKLGPERPLRAVFHRHLSLFAMPKALDAKRVARGLTIPYRSGFGAFPFPLPTVATHPDSPGKRTLHDVLDLMEQSAHVGTVADLVWTLPFLHDHLHDSSAFVAPVLPVREAGELPYAVCLFERLAGGTNGEPRQAVWKVTLADGGASTRLVQSVTPVILLTHTRPSLPRPAVFFPQ